MIFVVMNFRKEHVMYHYMYHYGSPAGMVLPTVYLLIFAGALFVAAVEYIFLGMGLYRMAANRNHPSPWMAFVPFARTYLRGELSGDIYLKKRSVKNPGLLLVLMPIAYSVIVSCLLLVCFMFAIFGASVMINGGVEAVVCLRYTGSGHFDCLSSGDECIECTGGLSDLQPVYAAASCSNPCGFRYFCAALQRNLPVLYQKNTMLWNGAAENGQAGTRTDSCKGCCAERGAGKCGCAFGKLWRRRWKGRKVIGSVYKFCVSL